MLFYLKRLSHFDMVLQYYEEIFQCFSKVFIAFSYNNCATHISRMPITHSVRRISGARRVTRGVRRILVAHPVTHVM